MSNRETPFSLAYGTEAVIHAEIGIPTRRTIQRSDEENEEALRMNLNLLEECIEARRTRQVENYYNQRVHYKQFKVGEFVLRKNKLSKAENTSKLGPKWEGPYEVVETYGTVRERKKIVAKLSEKQVFYIGSNGSNVNLYDDMKEQLLNP
ncbi:hypothetical protein Tco_0866525 [Tanacetum coccineum]